MKVDNTFKQDFGNRLKGFLRLRNATQTQLAKHVGVNPATVHEWVIGNKSPRSDKYSIIADFLGIKIGELMGTVVKIAHNTDSDNLPCGSLESLFSDNPEVLKYLRASTKELIIEGKPSDLSCISEPSKMILKGAILNALKEAGVQIAEKEY